MNLHDINELEILEFLKRNLRDEYLDPSSFERFFKGTLEEILEVDNNHYELDARFTKTGYPSIIDFCEKGSL